MENATRAQIGLQVASNVSRKIGMMPNKGRRQSCLPTKISAVLVLLATVFGTPVLAGGLERGDDEYHQSGTNKKSHHENVTASETGITQSARNFMQKLSWGIGAAGGSYPHYPGADQRDSMVLPVPYLEYYGDQFQIDDKGLAAHIFDGETVRLDLSVNGALPVDSEDNRARIGMPDLELMGEFGPSLQFRLLTGENWEARLDLPVRMNLDLSGDFLRDRGITADPRFHVERHWPSAGNLRGLSAELEIGALYGDERYHDVFYAVAPSYVQADRAAYTPAGGLMAYRASSTVKYRHGSYLMIAYARFMDFSDHQNLQSPLMKKEDYFAGGLAFIRLFNGL